MSLLLQISDPHFGTERPSAVEALRRLVAREAPDVLVLSGDITQRATRDEFARARAFVDALAVPRLLAIPGNHDIPLFNLPARLFAPYAAHRRAFGHELEPEHAASDLLVLALNTTRWWRHKDGELSQAQIERVAQRLSTAGASQLRVVVVHQPVAVTRDEDRENLLHAHEAAVRRWSAAGCDLILGGHIHLPFWLPLSSRFADLPREVWAVQAGTAVSSRLRHEAGNSVNLLRTRAPDDGRCCELERWDFEDGPGEFRRVASEALRFGPGAGATQRAPA